MAIIEKDLIKVTVNQQVSRFVELGFHKILGQNDEQYRASFKLPPDVELFGRNRTGRPPVVVDPRIPLRDVHRAVGINEWASSLCFTHSGNIPEVPYIYWPLLPFLDSSEEEEKDKVQPNKEETTLFEVSALYLNHPEVFNEDHAFRGRRTIFKCRGIIINPAIMIYEEDGAVVNLIYDESRTGIVFRRQEIYLLASTKP